MNKTTTTRYDVADHLRTPDEMAVYLEVCLEAADGDSACIAKALGDIGHAMAWLRLRGMPVYRARERAHVQLRIPYSCLVEVHHMCCTSFRT